MTLFLILLLMTAAAIFAVLWPLARQNARARSGSDVAVYRDQIEELERDRAAGLIGQAEGQAARNEISRRLLAAADAEAVVATVPAAGSPRRRRTAALAALVLLPLGAGTLYLKLGSPFLPAAPSSARTTAPAEQRSIESLVAQVEAHLERNPEDGRGWEVVAPVYLGLGRFEDAVRARRNALRLLGASAAREADLGEALVAAGNGIVTADAKAAFDRALAADSAEVKARYFLGLAAEQDGKREEAAQIWRALLASAPAEASYRELVQGSLARLDPKAAAPGPTPDDMAAAEKLTPGQRNEMIRGMVARLAERLKTDGSDVEAWLRLVRAYMVLGERDKARAAASDARRAIGADGEKRRRLDDLVKGLGLEG